MKTPAALTILASTSMMVASAGETPPDPASILARAKEATGGKAWDALRAIHVEGKVATGGLEGSVVSWDDVRNGRYVQKFTLGPITGAEGYDGSVSWEQDASGQSKAEDSEEARLETVNGVYRRTMGYWFPDRHRAAIAYTERREEAGRSFDVLTLTPEGGRPFQMWIDARTALVDRTVEKRALETQTAFVSDYRKVGDLLLPFKDRTTTGDPKYDVVSELQKVELDPAIDAVAFQMPAPPPPDFAIASGARATTVPFALLNNHIYLDVTLNGKGPFRLLCDTGGANVVTPDLAKELGIEGVGAFEAKGVGEESEEISMAKVASLGVGAATVEDQLFAIFPLEGLSEAEGTPQKGIIGYEVFKRFVVTIDYARATLRLTLPDAYESDGVGVTVPFEFHGHTPQVDGELDGLPGKFTIDTGSRASLDLHVPFIEKNDLRARYAPKLEGVTGWGVGGASRSQVTRAGTLRIGASPGVTIEKPVTELSTQKGGAYTDPYVAGNIGAGLLKRFNLTFDYTRKKIVFVPNGTETRDAFDRAGMWMNLDAGGGVFVVVDVLAGSPAALAGLKVGDRVRSIDGKLPEDFPLPAARLKLRTDPPGTKVKLEIESGGKAREVMLVLRDLV